MHRFLPGLHLPAMEGSATVSQSHKPAHSPLFFEICVSEQSRTVGAYEVAALFRSDRTGFHRGRNPRLEIAHKLLWVVLNIVEHLVDGFALDNLVDFVAVLVHTDMHGIGIAEEIVHVAEYFLIGTHEEHAEIIRFSGLERMHGQSRRSALRRYEICYLAVGIAGYVLNGASACRFLVKTRYRCV